MTASGGKRGLKPQNHQQALLVLGAALLLSSVLLGFTGLTGTYEHDHYDEAVSEITWESRSNINTTYDALSAREKRVVDNVVDSKPSVYTVEPLDSFQYPIQGRGTAVTVVEYPDRTVVLEGQRDPTRPIALVTGGFQISAVIAGILLMLLGVVSLRPEHPRVSDRLRAGLERWVPISSFILLGLPFLMFRGILISFGLVPIVLVILSARFRTLFDVDLGSYGVSVLTLPILWTGLVVVFVAGGHFPLVDRVFLYLPTIILAVLSYTFGWLVSGPQ